MIFVQTSGMYMDYQVPSSAFPPGKHLAIDADQEIKNSHRIRELRKQSDDPMNLRKASSYQI